MSYGWLTDEEIINRAYIDPHNSAVWAEFVRRLSDGRFYTEQKHQLELEDMEEDHKREINEADREHQGELADLELKVAGLENRIEDARKKLNLVIGEELALP